MKTVQGQIFCNTTKLVGKRPDVFYFDNRTMQKVDENLAIVIVMWTVMPSQLKR